jgi:hypothetical protein
MGATPLFYACVCVYGCNATFSRSHKREKVALHPLKHAQTWKSGVAPINTHTNVKGCNATFSRVCVCLWVQRHFVPFVCVFMGATPLVHVCVCDNGCNATFSRVCVCLWVQRHFVSFVCVFIHPLTHTQTWKSGVTCINTHANEKRWRYTH